jgi:colanic acid biosynthesis protein WcaH
MRKIDTMVIPEYTYRKIQLHLPILCVDLLVRYRGKYLLIKRNEEPMRGVFWVIGGRVLKGEDLRQAASRKLREETGLTARSSDMTMVGIYEDTYGESSLGPIPGGYHTVAVVFEVFVDSLERLRLDDTSSDWGLFDRPPERFRVKAFDTEDVYA